MTKEVSFRKTSADEEKLSPELVNSAQYRAENRRVAFADIKNTSYQVDGTPDYDLQHGEIFQGVYPTGPEIQRNVNSPIQIKMVYPSKEFFKTNTEFASRHKSMQAEADEHY